MIEESAEVLGTLQWVTNTMPSETPDCPVPNFDPFGLSISRHETVGPSIRGMNGELARHFEGRELDLWIETF